MKKRLLKLLTQQDMILNIVFSAMNCPTPSKTISIICKRLIASLYANNKTVLRLRKLSSFWLNKFLMNWNAFIVVINKLNIISISLMYKDT